MRARDSVRWIVDSSDWRGVAGAMSAAAVCSMMKSTSFSVAPRLYRVINPPRRRWPSQPSPTEKEQRPKLSPHWTMHKSSAMAVLWPIDCALDFVPKGRSEIQKRRQTVLFPLFPRNAPKFHPESILNIKALKSAQGAPENICATHHPTVEMFAGDLPRWPADGRVIHWANGGSGQCGNLPMPMSANKSPPKVPPNELEEIRPGILARLPVLMRIFQSLTTICFTICSCLIPDLDEYRYYSTGH